MEYKVIETHNWTCPICKCVYDNYEDAYQCMNHHITVPNESNADIDIRYEYDKNSRWPKNIVIRDTFFCTEKKYYSEENVREAWLVYGIYPKCGVINKNMSFKLFYNNKKATEEYSRLLNDPATRGIEGSVKGYVKVPIIDLCGE